MKLIKTLMITIICTTGAMQAYCLGKYLHGARCRGKFPNTGQVSARQGKGELRNRLWLQR
jgi:hypothetical protein